MSGLTAPSMTPQRALSQWQTSGLQPMPQSPYNMPGMPLSRYNPYLSTPTFPLYHAPDNVDAFFGGTSAQSAQTAASASETAQAAAQAQLTDLPLKEVAEYGFLRYATKSTNRALLEKGVENYGLQAKFKDLGIETIKKTGDAAIKKAGEEAVKNASEKAIIAAGKKALGKAAKTATKKQIKTAGEEAIKKAAEETLKKSAGGSVIAVGRQELAKTFTKDEITQTGRAALTETVRNGKRPGPVTCSKPSLKFPKIGGKPSPTAGIGEEVVKNTTKKVTKTAAKKIATKVSEETAETAQRTADQLAKRAAIVGANGATSEVSCMQIAGGALRNSFKAGGRTIWFITVAFATGETIWDGYKEYKQKGRVGMGTVKAGVENFCSAGLGTAAAIVGTALGTPAVGLIAGFVGGLVGKYIGKGINWCIGKCSPDYAKA